ncbi:MAG TPA: tetratricopeptide repeat protein [Syntrophales bacterium]|nr:tetratricopeptide repeat protein [Syntrophales bacterium]
MHERLVAGPDFKKANDYAKKGNYKASLSEYEKIMAQYPRVGDRALFEMGMIYLSARNQHKDYQKSLEYFQKLMKNYPDSEYRQNSGAMIFLLTEITNRDKRMISQKRQIDELVQEVEAAEKKIEQMKEVDMNLKQRKKTVQ